MKPSLRFFVAFAVVALLYSCSKSNETDLSPTPTDGGTTGSCDTTNMSFVTNIKPILQGSCYSCHSNANYTESGFKLEDYPDVKVHADEGDLIGVITHAAGYPPMPQGGTKLSDCNINKIKAWINRGAPNN